MLCLRRTAFLLTTALLLHFFTPSSSPLQLALLSPAKCFGPTLTSSHIYYFQILNPSPLLSFHPSDLTPNMLSYRILAILLGALSFCNAHHIITNIYVNGVDQGDGVCIRIPPSTGPVVDVRSDDMACNVGGWRPLDKFASIGAGDNVSFKWKTWPDGSQEVPIDISHEGFYSFILYHPLIGVFADVVRRSLRRLPKESRFVQ